MTSKRYVLALLLLLLQYLLFLQCLSVRLFVRVGEQAAVPRQLQRGLPGPGLR